MILDVIIVGAGPAGLLAAALMPGGRKTLLLNNGKAPARKLLIAGGGKCNLTNAGQIKDFIPRYGENGPKIRRCLYRFSNEALVRYLEDHGIKTWTREDGKIFPKSLKGADILGLLLREAERNGTPLRNNVEIRGLWRDEDADAWCLQASDGERFLARKVLLAAGGLSYPSTGSNGSLLPALRSLGIGIAPQRPALVPLEVEGYPFADLAGISLKNVRLSKGKHREDGDLLLAHRCFSGPAILNLSRYAGKGEALVIGWLGELTREAFLDRLAALRKGRPRKAAHAMGEAAPGLPGRFVDLIVRRAGIPVDRNIQDLSREQMEALAAAFTEDAYRISGTSGFDGAMCTAGGIRLDEVDLNDFSLKRFPGLYAIGELLDVDGDTGGYNLQFAFSSGAAWARGMNGE